jgi:hypothetical protein
MAAVRSPGLAGSIGSQAPPALAVASTAITDSGERSSRIATRLSGRTPSFRRWWAKPLARRSSSP